MDLIVIHLSLDEEDENNIGRVCHLFITIASASEAENDTYVLLLVILTESLIQNHKHR